MTLRHALKFNLPTLVHEKQPGLAFGDLEDCTVDFIVVEDLFAARRTGDFTSMK